MYLAWTNTAHSEGIIIFSDCRSALEAIQGGKTKLTQEINSHLLFNEAIRKSCILQWIPANLDTERNKLVAYHANEARKVEPVPLSTTVFDANAVAKQKLCANPLRKFSLPELSYSREIPTTIARLRTNTARECRSCPTAQEHM